MTETTLEWLEFHNHLQDLCHGLLENQRAYADCVLKVRIVKLCLHFIFNTNFNEIVDTGKGDLLPSGHFICIK